MLHCALSFALNSMPEDIGGVSYNCIPRETLELMNYIKDNLCCDVDIGQIARLSPQAISGRRRQFKCYMGMSPHQYHLQERMRLAQELLMDPGMTVAEVAKVLGFHDRGYFAKAFKRCFGCSPEHWRETNGRGD